MNKVIIELIKSLQMPKPKVLLDKKLIERWKRLKKDGK